MNTKGTAFKIIRYFIAIGILVSGTARWGAPAAGKVYALAAAIGGCIYTGGGSVTYTQNALGEPVANWNTAYAPSPDTPPIKNAQVMVQNQHSGGAFITYATTGLGANGNCWQATVGEGDYIVMFSAPGHDSTSREFTVDATGVVTNPTGSGATQDAYLPPLLDLDGDGVKTDLPRANLLHYVFYDKKVNGNDDGALIDPGLNGVTINVRDEEGNLLASKVTGAEDFTTADGVTFAGAARYGYVYFTGLPPGEVVVESDPSTATQADNPHFTLYRADAGRAWYLTYTEEGGPTWDPKLYPGDPGTEAGFYLTWHGFIEKLGNDGGGNPAISGSISGVLMDADGNDPEEPFPATLGGRVAPTNSGYATGLDVEPNSRIPDGALALYTVGDFPELIATTEATQPTGQNDPNGGEFNFVNVPPGQYEIYAWDIPLNNVPIMGTAVTVNPLATSSVAILMPRFGARAQGYVMNNGVPVAGARVITHYKSGITEKETTTDANGWFNFDFLPEIEVMGHVLVALPDGSTYRGKIITEQFDEDGVGPIAPINVTHNAMNRYVQWMTYNYLVDIQVEDIPAGVGDINGVVYYDHFKRGTWAGDGAYDEREERLLEGVTVNLYQTTDTMGGMTLIATTTTGKFDAAATLAQGWDEPYTWPPNEIGGVFAGPAIGFYEFRDLAPGTYKVEVVPPTGYADPYDKFFTSLNGNGTGIAGIPGTVGDEDILFFDGALFHMFFDGSAKGLPANADIDALHVLDQDTFYVSFERDLGTAIPAGVTSLAFTAQDEDIVLYDAGDWSLTFDGSAYGLGDIAAEDVDSVSILADGRMVISTRGNPNAAGNPNPLPTDPAGVWNGTNPRPQDEDLLVFDPATGYFDLYFDGSDIALNNTSAEQVDGAAVDGNGNIYLTTTGTFVTSTSLTGGGNDVFVCRGAVTGSATSCASQAFFFQGIGFGVDNTTAESLDALSLFGSGLAPDVIVIGGQSRRVNLGVNTTNVANGAIFGVPLAGEIEGGVFDDTNLDMNPLSLLYQEKAGIVGAPVGVYDHYNYLLGVGFMGNPLCYTGSTVCPPGEPLGQKPEMERRFAPGVHRYKGNDPAFPGYNPAYDPMELSYTFAQGAYKFEADWSLLPATGGGPLADMCVVDLVGSAIGNPWGAQVVATVKDDANIPVMGARVIGNWSTAGTMECTTNGAGQCTITLTTVEPQSAPSVTFDVTNVDPVGQPWYAYNPAGPGCVTQATIANPGGGPPPGGMRVTDLDGVGTISEGTKWFATVTINVSDGVNPVATAKVFGTWSNGKAVSCTTNAAGQCSVISETIENVAITSISFTVNNVTHENPAIPAYNAALNNDPDGDSDGTTIAVLRP
jgi:hypothetical protein